MVDEQWTVDPARSVGSEARKTIRERNASGFFRKYLSGVNVLDIGYRGADPENQPIVPWAIGIERDYPGYDGVTLPFGDLTQDAVHSSHCLEHIPNPDAALAEWFRVLKIGGYLVLTIPHQQLFERKPTPTSRWAGNEHLRFYTLASFTTEVEGALPLGEFRWRIARDNDADYDYSLPVTHFPEGCYEIEAVIQRIARPAWVSSLRLSDEALATIEMYKVLIGPLVRSGQPPDIAALRRFGAEHPIPPYAVLRPIFSDVPEATMRAALWPLVDPGVVAADWYLAKHPDARRVCDGSEFTAAEHYQRSGYFECKLPNARVGLYG